ncbi:hypothetical protein EJD97_010118 [Solanum chilense]|uniref:CCHC-type domain-containing protein n=1 Tax=Solanum chilense TaxID=4083 RepID=A0A6N2BH67_SOLCI|nr:hypothetical protein EJD97_010118 [Solanum chilense]
MTYVGVSATFERLTTPVSSEGLDYSHDKRRGVAAVEHNQGPPQAPTEREVMPVNPVGLTDANVRASLAQMAQDITMQSQAMISQGPRLQRISRNSWIRYRRFWWPSGPQILRKKGWLPISSRLLHRLSARGGRITKLRVEFWSRIDDIQGVFPEVYEIIHQVEESRKKKHTRTGNRSRQAEKIFLKNSSLGIRHNPKFKKIISHQGESNSPKGLYDRNSKSRVKRNNEVDTPHDRRPCRKCSKLHGGECMMVTNACYSCGKYGHMMKDCPNSRSQEQGKERFQPNCPSEESPRRQQFFALKSKGAGEDTSGEVSGFIWIDARITRRQNRCYSQAN